MVILLELSATFDTVDHNLMLSILESRYGITDQALKWYETYQSPCYMKVCINPLYSNQLSLMYGVPQGSCSGTNNFVAYCAPIEHTLIDNSIDLSGYADDHSLQKSFKPALTGSEASTVLSLKKAVSDIGEWISQMRLKLNQNKTKFIMLGSKRKLPKAHTDSIDLDRN